MEKELMEEEVVQNEAVLPEAQESVCGEDGCAIPQAEEARVETFTENLRITVAITDAEGHPLTAQTDENGEVYVVSQSGTKVIKSEMETTKAKKQKRKKHAIGLLCFFSIMFIALSIILDVVFKNAFDGSEIKDKIAAAGTVCSSLAQAVAYVFLAISGFSWINEPGRKLGWKVLFWIGLALVFVTLVVGTTLAFVTLGATK